MTDALKDKVAVITGGATGIGFAIAERFAAEGARVYISGRRQEALTSAQESLGDRVTAIQADVSQVEQVSALFDRVKDEEGRIDVLVANAGSGALSRLGNITEELFDQTFDSNVKGTWLTAQGALPLLVDGASVILLSSTTAATGGAAFSVYAASKAAIRNFARSWMLDLKDQHIRVNALAPGPTRTPGLTGLAPGAAEDMLAGMASQVPLGRVADPAEIASAALFLASDESSFVNGIELFVDGGAAQA